MISSIKLAALLASRLCHDLTSPIGAIANGLELMADGGYLEMRDQSLDLIELSASEAIRRLAFFRVALGAAGGLKASLPLSKICGIAGEFFVDSKIKLEWSEKLTVSSDLPPITGRILLNLILLTAESMPRGGRIKVTMEGNGPWTFSTVGIGIGVKMRSEHLAALQGSLDDNDLNAQNVQAVYLAELVKSVQGRIGIKCDADKITLSAYLTAG